MEGLTKIPIHKRRIAIFSNEDTKNKLLKTLDWKNIATDLLFTNIFTVGYKLWKKEKVLKDSYFTQKDLPFPIFDIDNARESFRFPPSHPTDGMVYSSSDIEDDLYVPFSSFHKLMYESKMSAFTKLCSSLGAKSCTIIYVEENNKDITSKVTGKNIPSNIGNLNVSTEADYNNKNNQNVSIQMSFPKTNKIEKYKSKWLNGEPSWQAMQDIRLENDIDKYIAEFNYIDEMGVTASLAGSLNGMGLNIGGKFEECKKLKYKFEVEFWPKNNIV